MKHWFGLILTLILYSGIQGQNYIGVIPQVDSVSIGQPFDVEITVQLDNQNTSGVIDFSTLDTMVNLMYEVDTTFFNREGDIEILNGGPFKVSPQAPTVDLKNLGFEGLNFRGFIKVAIYDVGRYQIPNPQLIINGNQALMPTASRPVTVFLPDEIQSMVQDSIVVAPIQTIIEEPLKLEDFKLPLIALGILIAAILLIYFFRSRRTDQLHTSVEEIIEPADVIAKRKLYELKEKELWQKGMIKEYQSELTYIIREYIEKRYGILALEMTTYEILRAVPAEVDQNKLQNILQIADMVKFAKADPPVDIHSRFMDMAFKMIEETTPPEIQETEDA